MAASGTKKATVQDFGTYDVNANLSQEEVRRQLQSLLGASWLAQAQICVEPNGDLKFNRPPAAAKG